MVFLALWIPLRIHTFFNVLIPLCTKHNEKYSLCVKRIVYTTNRKHLSFQLTRLLYTVIISILQYAYLYYKPQYITRPQMILTVCHQLISFWLIPLFFFSFPISISCMGAPHSLLSRGFKRDKDLLSVSWFGAAWVVLTSTCRTAFGT